MGVFNGLTWVYSQVLSAEAHEESITNQLLKRLQQLQSEKTRLVAAVEQEEEYLTNTLSKKLEAVRSVAYSVHTANYSLVPLKCPKTGCEQQLVPLFLNFLAAQQRHRFVQTISDFAASTIFLMPFYSFWMVAT